MATQEQYEAAFATLDQATTALADEIHKLRQEKAAGLTEAQEAGWLARLGEMEGRLRVMATNPADPVPDAPGFDAAARTAAAKRAAGGEYQATSAEKAAASAQGRNARTDPTDPRR